MVPESGVVRRQKGLPTKVLRRGRLHPSRCRRRSHHPRGRRRHIPVPLLVLLVLHLQTLVFDLVYSRKHEQQNVQENLQENGRHKTKTITMKCKKKHKRKQLERRKTGAQKCRDVSLSVQGQLKHTRKYKKNKKEQRE